jgi:hypothetical protein
MHTQRTLTRCIATGMFAGSAVVLAAACGSSAPTPAPNEASVVASGTPTSTSASVASNVLNGTYTIHYDDGDERTWTVISCGPGCADVVQKSNAPLIPSTVHGRAQLTDTMWVLPIRRPDAVVCDDGGEHDGTSTWTWDAKTLEGLMTLQQFRDDCGDDMAPSPPDQFTLAKVSDDALPPGMRSY